MIDLLNQVRRGICRTLFGIADFESRSTDGAIRAELHKQRVVANDRRWNLGPTVTANWGRYRTIALIGSKSIINAKRMRFNFKLVYKFGNDVGIRSCGDGVIAQQIIAITLRIIW